MASFLSVLLPPNLGVECNIYDTAPVVRFTRTPSSAIHYRVYEGMPSEEEVDLQGVIVIHPRRDASTPPPSFTGYIAYKWDPVLIASLVVQLYNRGEDAVPRSGDGYFFHVGVPKSASKTSCHQFRRDFIDRSRAPTGGDGVLERNKRDALFHTLFSVKRDAEDTWRILDALSVYWSGVCESERDVYKRALPIPWE